MAGVKIVVRNAGGELVQLASFINRVGWEVKQNAEEGSVGISTLYMDDLDESIYDTLGFTDGARRALRIVDYESGKILQYGYTARRTINRTYDVYGSPLGRAWSIEIWDPNAILQRRILTHKSAKRPRESDVERIQWLVGTPEWDLVTQFLIASSPTSTMSKADYRGQTIGDVLSDCSQQSRKNFWVDLVDLQEGEGEELTLWYGRDNREVYYSTLSISNDLADLDVEALSEGTTTLIYPPANDTEYSMDPTRVFSGIYGTWEKGAVYRHRNTTGTAFERWDTAMQWPNIHEKDRAIDRAERMLDRLDEEDERIETHIIVPSSQAHLIRAGMRIPLKLTHVPRLTEFTDCRVLARGLAPIADGTRYRIPLTLEPVGPSDPPPPECLAVDETQLQTILGGSLRTTWDSGPEVGQVMVSIMSTRGLHATDHVPMAKSVSPPPESVVGSEWDYLGYAEYNSGGSNNQSMEAASKVATADDVSGVFDWLNLAGSGGPLALSVKFTGGTVAEDIFTATGQGDIDMTLSGITISEPGILVVMFQVHVFDQPPHILTSPSDLTELYNGPRWGDFDRISAGYVEYDAAGTYSLTWHASNTYPDWQWQIVGVFVPGELC